MGEPAGSPDHGYPPHVGHVPTVMRSTPNESRPGSPSAHGLEPVTTTHVFMARMGRASSRPGPPGTVARKHCDPDGTFGAYHEAMTIRAWLRAG